MKSLFAAILMTILLSPSGHAAASQTSVESPDDALVQAAAQGDAAEVNRLLKEGAHLDAADRFGQTALLAAVQNNRTDIVKLLIERGADVNGVDAAALPLAADQNNLDIAKLLLEKAANPEDKDGAGDTALLKSIDRGNTNMLRLLLEKGASPDDKDRNGMPPLLLASISGNAEAVKMLLAKGANVNATDGLENTALHVAVENGRTSVVEVLLANHANIDAGAQFGYTPLFAACNACQAETARQLLEHRASISARANNGETPLHAAAHRGCPEVVKLLLDHGANIESTDNDGFTPLLDGAEAGGVIKMRKDRMDVENFPAVQVVNLLLDRGANLEARSNNEQTALHRAAFRDRPDVVKDLLSRGANIQAMDNSGNTALSLVNESRRGFERIVKEREGNHGWGYQQSVDRILSDKQEVIRILEDALSRHPPSTFTDYVGDLQNHPRDRARRDHAVQMAATLPSLPPIPDQGMRLYNRAVAIMSEGKPERMDQAMSSLRGALNFAPWWGDAYHRLSQTLELRGQYELAAKNLNYYLALRPPEAEARAARSHLLELQSKMAGTPSGAEPNR